MLSYQHAYHAGNLADVHKHALLAFMLAAMAAKTKPLAYLETHAGRGLYDLGSPEAARTGEAAAGIDRALAWFPDGDPYRRAVEETRRRHGPRAYPGSPLVAALTLRPEDRAGPRRAAPAGGRGARPATSASSRGSSGATALEAALAWTPPTPRRGLMLVDPSWEVKADYERDPGPPRRVHRKWGVGVLALWYPILADARHAAMLAALAAALPDGAAPRGPLPARPRGARAWRARACFVVNPPWRTAERAAWLSERFAGASAVGVVAQHRCGGSPAARGPAPR